MKKSLLDIITEALLGKRIKLYKVKDTQYRPEGIIYYLADKEMLSHPKKCQIIEETHGTVQTLTAEHYQYEGDSYYFTIVDDNGEVLDVHGLYTVTTNVEILN